MRTYNVGKITNSNDRKYFCGPGNDLMSCVLINSRYQNAAFYVHFTFYFQG